MSSQAAISFKNVRKSEDIGFFYNSTKDKDKAMIFFYKVLKTKNIILMKMPRIIGTIVLGIFMQIIIHKNLLKYSRSLG